MKSLFTAQGITTLFTIASLVLALFGKTQLSAFFANPELVQTILGFLGILGVGGVSLMPPVTEEKK